MSIYREHSLLDYGDIFKITDVTDKEGNYSYTTKSPISIKCVFKNDRMIWPHHNKYMFWVSTKEDIMDRQGAVQNISVKAGRDNGNNKPGGTQQVKIYIRSCSRFYRTRYPYRVILSDNWVSVDGAPSNESSFIMQANPGQGTEKEWDSVLTVNIAPNTYRSQRVTCITMYQINPLTGLPSPTEAIQKVYISQDADSIWRTATYEQGNTDIRFYTDDSYSLQTFNYGYEDGTGAAGATDATQTVYFKIVGYAWMWSGKNNEVYFGQNANEAVTEQFFSGNHINKITNINYLGEGKWIATLSFEDNLPDASNLKSIIKDATINPSNEIDYNGGDINVNFSLYNTGTSYSRSTNLKLTIPVASNGEYEGSAVIDNCVTLWQKGGEVTIPITDAKPTISLDVMSQFWISKVTDVLSEENRYRQVWRVSTQESKMSSVIEEVELYDSNNNVLSEYEYNADTNAKMRFTIMSNTESYEERKAVFNITYNTAYQSLNFTQNKADAGNWYKMTPIIRPELLTGELMITATNVSGLFISNIRDLKYTGGKWQIQFDVADNDKYISPIRINTTSVPTYVSNVEHNENENQVYVDFRVESGEVDSKRRCTELDIVANSINCSDYVEIYQRGTSSATDTIYHDDCIGYVENVNDNLKTNFTSSTSSHIYHIPLKILDNTTKSDEAAYMVPTRIANWSVGMLDNNNLSMVYVQVKGYMAAKGIEREVKFNIVLTSETCENVPFNLTQEATPVIFDKTKEVNCTDLGIDDFVIAEGSEAEYMKNASPIYTSDGWYVLPLHVYDNTTPTAVAHRILINGVDVVNDASKNKSYTISNWKTTTTLPMTAAWYQSGTSITRKATIIVSNDYKIEPIWNDVPFIGSLALNSKYNNDWKCEVTKGSAWLSVSGYGVSISTTQNKSYEKRDGILHYTFYDDKRNTLFEDDIKIYQECMNSVADLDLTFNIEKDSIELDEVLGNLQSTTISIQSYDLDFLEYGVEYDAYENLSITKEIIPGYGVKLTFTPIVHLYNTNPKSWNVEVRQIDPWTGDPTGNKVTIKVTQPSYWLYATLGNGETSKILEYNDSTNLQVISYKEYVDGTTEKSDYTTVASDYSWISISDKSVANDTTDIYVCKAYAMNVSALNYSATIKVTQIQSNICISLTIGQYSWRDSEFDESWIHIYNVEDIQTRNFWSQVNEQDTPLSEIELRWDKDNTTDNHNWCMLSLEKDDKKTAKLVIQNNSLLYGDVPVSDVLKLRNKKYAIGSTRIIKHATIFSITSEYEDKDGMVVYMSPYKKELWSNYYITSTIDNIDEEYDVICKEDLTILKNGNVLKITPNTNNDTNSRIEYSAKIVQKKSNNTINLKIIQLTKDEYEEVYY